jgi:hypothetical protein
VPERAHELFADYADAYARGERPSAEEYLGRAGAEAEALAAMIDRFVAATPARRPDESEIAVTEAWVRGESPLLHVRVARGITRDGIVDALIERLGLDRAKRDKVKRYYHELESGLLDARRVDRRLWGAIAETVRARVDEIARWRPIPVTAAQPAGAFLRAGNQQVAFRARMASLEEPISASAPGPEPRDEIDRLFTGG